MVEEANREGLEVLTGSCGRKGELNSSCQSNQTKPTKQKASRQIGLGYSCWEKDKIWNYAREIDQGQFHFPLSKTRRHTCLHFIDISDHRAIIRAWTSKLFYIWVNSKNWFTYAVKHFPICVFFHFPLCEMVVFHFNKCPIEVEHVEFRTSFYPQHN